MIAPLLERLLAGESLSADEAQGAIEVVMRGELSEAEMAALLIALRAKGESVDEIAGAARALRVHAIPAEPERADLVDVVGTGGDGSGTFNISTAAALIAAGAGAGVAKHGNRAVSSRCGAADVLEALGVRIDLDPGSVAACIDEVGFGFLFAPTHHPAMRHVAPVRRALGVRTIFNLLGPLANPAGTRRMVVGVYSPALVEPFAHVLSDLGIERALVVHGHGGVDELTPLGPCTVGWATPDGVRVEALDPLDLGIERCTVDELSGGDPAESAALIEGVLAGVPGARLDAALLTAAAALVAAGRAPDLETGLADAREAVASGSASALLGRLREYTNAGVAA